MSNLIRIKQINAVELSGFIGEILNQGQIPIFVTYTGANIVYSTGDQTVSGLKDFVQRPRVSGVEVALVGEYAFEMPSGFLVFTSGDQIISGIKTFKSRPQVDGSGIAVSAELVASGNKLAYDIQTLSGDAVLDFGNQTIFGTKTFKSRPEVDGSGIAVSAELVASGNKLAYDIQTLSGDAVLDFGNQTIFGIKTFKSRPQVDGSGIAVSAELVASGNKLAYDIQTLSGDAVLDFGNQTIFGTKTFKSRPEVDGSGILLSGEAEKIETAWFSWSPPFDQNLGLNTDIFPPWNNQRFNSNTNVFQLFNSGQSGALPVARVAVKQPGYYNLGFQYYGYDLKLDNPITIKLYRSTQPNSAFSLVRWTSKARTAALDSDGDSIESWTNTYITATGYYSMTLNSSGQNPFTILGHDASFGIPTFSFHLTKLRSI